MPKEIQTSAMAPAARRAGAGAPLVWIVILNYNGAQITLNCIDSVLKIDHPNFRVIVVDNLVLGCGLRRRIWRPHFGRRGVAGPWGRNHV